MNLISAPTDLSGKDLPLREQEGEASFRLMTINGIATGLRNSG